MVRPTEELHSFFPFDEIERGGQMGKYMLSLGIVSFTLEWNRVDQLCPVLLRCYAADWSSR